MNHALVWIPPSPGELSCMSPGSLLNQGNQRGGGGNGEGEGEVALLKRAEEEEEVEKGRKRRSISDSFYSCCSSQSETHSREPIRH